MVAAGCGRRHATVDTVWPATAEDVSLQAEIRATAAELADAGAAAEPLAEDAPGVQVREIEFGGFYALEVVLGDASFDDPLPLVMLLHGRGDAPRVPGGPFAHASTPMRLILPRAPDPLGHGFTWLSVSVGSGRIAELAESLHARAGQLAAALGDLAAARPTLGTPIVTGFSQGGMLTLTLAIEHPEIVGDALTMAGWLPPELEPREPVSEERRVAIRVAHGTADPVIPYEPTRELVERLAGLGWDALLVPFEDVEHVMSPEMNEQFERWLEAALSARAPGLAGEGLGEPGAEAESYSPFTPLDAETVEAIEAAEEALHDDAGEAEAGPEEAERGEP